MAKLNVSGLTIQDILDLNFDGEIQKLSRQDLATLTSRLVSASNKRIRRLEKSEIGKLSPAYKSRMERGGFFSVRGADRNKLEQTFAEAKGFLQLKTSTATGWKNVRNKIAEELGVPKDFINSSSKAKKFWKTYREVTEGKEGLITRKGRGGRMDSDRIQALIAERYGMKGGFRQKRGDVVSDINKKIDDIYEDMMKEEQRYSGTADEIEEDGYDEYEDI